MAISHQFQLVLQLPENCPLTSLDFEDDLAEALHNPNDGSTATHVVDGNSYGGGTIEFFIHTNDPQAAFELTKIALSSAGLLEIVTVAYRRFSESEFHVLWPTDYRGVFRV